MEKLSNNHKKRGVFVFSIPFSAPGNYKHVEKLLSCLAPHCGHLFVVADRRVTFVAEPDCRLQKIHLPPLHYVQDIQPLLWSVVFWMLKLAWVLLCACTALIRNCGKFEIVVCYKGVYYAPVLLIANLLGKKTLIYLPNSDSGVVSLTYGKGVLGRVILQIMQILELLNRNLADRCVIQSHHLIDELGLQSRPEKVRLGVLPLDTALYKEHIPLPGRSTIVGFVGRLSSIKGVIPLIEAAPLCRNNIVLHLVGDGPLRLQIEKMLECREIKNVRLTGWATSGELVDQLNSFKLLVLPTSSEGIPNVIVEAMACGTPVLATSVGGIPDLIEHEITGFILPAIDPESIAQSIDAALDSPALAIVAARGCEKVMETYSFAAASTQWDGILNELTTNFTIEQRVLL